jgi:small subunit ribosomal protein S21
VIPIVLYLGHAHCCVGRQAATCPKSCPKTATFRSLRFFQLEAIVPIGWHKFRYRRRFGPWLPVGFRPIRAPVAERLAIGPIPRSIQEEPCVQVLVRDNNVDQALKVLKKKMQREGVFREMKLRGHYEKPSERRVREKAEAIRRARKLARKKLQREGLLPMKPRVIPGVPGRGGPVRAPRF